jgi:hypothetical protein
MLPIGHVPTQIYVNKTLFGFPYSIFYLKRRMSSKNNCSVQIYVLSQKGGGFSLKNLVIFQTVDSKAIKTYPRRPNYFESTNIAESNDI